MHQYYLASFFIGVGLAVVGLALLIHYGLPSWRKRKQAVDDEAESRRFLGRVGLAFIIAGYLMQIISNLLG